MVLSTAVWALIPKWYRNGTGRRIALGTAVPILGILKMKSWLSHHGSSISTFLALLIDHGLKRAKKLCYIV
jgi:hypothetical protein